MELIVTVKQESIIDPLECLYHDHKVEEDMVISPEVIQKPIKNKRIVILPKSRQEKPLEEGNSGHIVPECLESEFVVISEDTTRNQISKGHERNILYCCEVCGVQFHNTNDLSQHIQIHCVVLRKQRITIQNKKPFRCDICNERFKKQSVLKLHLLTHADRKPSYYHCHICNKRYMEKQSLKYHLGIHYSCDICKRRFSENDSLKKHQKVHDKK